MKLWDKGVEIDRLMEDFTVGRDRDMDVRLARWDVVGSIAHASMLAHVGLLSPSDADVLVHALSAMLEEIDTNGFVIEEGVEDVHSQVEKILVERCGHVGKRIHVGRSRNDQVALDMKLFLRHEMRTLRGGLVAFATLLLDSAERHQHLALPGFTHYQVAMPSSFGLWFGGFAEACIEDVAVLDMAIDAANANPLGSAAGYGSNLPLDRDLVTRALNFDRLHVTSTFAQMSRGRTERLCAMALAQVAATLARFAADVVQYCSEAYGFLSLPDAFVTGSSIMPHKRNPDVFEVLRARCNRLQALPLDIGSVLGNLPSGYHRDVQFTKDRIIEGIDELQLCLRVASHVVPHPMPVQGLMDDSKYDLAYTVDAVNALVGNGMPFRDAYKHVAEQVARGEFVRPTDDGVANTAHIGSVANPGLTVLRDRLRMLVTPHIP